MVTRLKIVEVKIGILGSLKIASLKKVENDSCGALKVQISFIQMEAKVFLNVVQTSLGIKY